MKFQLIITSHALQDTKDAYYYYEQIRAGLGEQFLENLERRYGALSENPELYSYSDDKKILRDVIIEGFPYLIVYEISDSYVVIFSIHNTNRKPYYQL
jgi:plasmid stabilization system protein ParE